MEPFKSNDIIFGDGIDSTEFKKMELKKAPRPLHPISEGRSHRTTKVIALWPSCSTNATKVSHYFKSTQKHFHIIRITCCRYSCCTVQPPVAMPDPLRREY